MADNQLVITAGLNIPETVSLIQDQLDKKVAPVLHLNIMCGIDTKNLDIKAIQKSINSAVKNADLKLDIGEGAIKNVTNKTVEAFNSAYNMVGKMGEMTKKEFNAQTKQMLKEFQDAWKQGMESGDFTAYTAAFDKIEQRIREFSRGDVQQLRQLIDDLRRDFTDGSTVSIGSNLMGWLDKATGYNSVSREYLDAIYGSGNYTISLGNAGYDTLIKNEDDANAQRIVKVAQKILEYKQKINSVGWGLDELEESGAAFEKISRELEDRVRQIVGLPELVRDDEWATILSSDDLARIEQGEIAINGLNDSISKLNQNEAGLEGFLTSDEWEQFDTGAQRAQKAMESLAEAKSNLQYEFDVRDEDITSRWVTDAEDQLTGFVVSVKDAEGVVRNFNYALSEEGLFEKISTTGSDKGVVAMFQKATKEADTLERRIISLKAAADDVNTARPIKSEEGIKAVSEAYDKAKAAIEAVRGANNETFLELDNEAKKAVDNLSNVIKAQRNIETAATKLRAKPIEIIKKEELSDLNAFIATMSNSAIPDITILTEKAEQLRTELSNVGENDKQGLADYLDNFSNLQAEFKAVNTQAKIVKQTIAELDRLLGNVQFANNKSNPEVVSNVADINALKANMQEIYAEIGRIDSPEALQIVTNKLSALKATTDNVVGSAKQLQTTLKNTARDDALSAKINKLAADMKNFAVANERATKSQKLMSDGMTFADKWSELMSRMAKGADLTETEVRELRNELILFGKAAQTEGLKGESVWGKFLNSFKTMSSYITANMVFNFVKRQLWDMANEVIAVDSAMVELRKVTVATDAEFEKFATSAAKTGRELGASISDVINATSTFSRAGFSLPDAEELGRVATLYKNVGDGINIDSASESIISIMKAFNAEVSEAERIVDRINKVSNNFAIDSGGLGESLKRVASAMASANNTLDETIALTTVANEIVQDPVAVAQAWRTVSMRIRGAKAELEQAGEDTEGMVESTAKLQNMIKGMTGVDIMIDADTFKSTYDIIKEIGAVWDDLKDIEQAQVLEAIAGKRQANVVASALRNYERLDDVLQTSIKSEGSAMQEQEEYAKSIQYSLDSLKASYQSLAQTIMKSDFLKGLIDTGSTLLQILDKVIDKIGLLPPLLTTIMAFKGKNVLFGTVVDEVDKTTKHLTLMNQQIGAGNTKGLKGIVEALKSIKIQAIGAEVAAMALNAALTLGVSVAITKLTSAISDWVNAEKNAAREAEEFRKKQSELREEGLKNAEAYEKEKNELNSILSQYLELASSTKDAADVKKSLSSLQDQLIDRYGKEAGGIDLVNKSLKENIDLMLQKQELDNKQWQRENVDAIQAAKDYFGIKNYNDAVQGRTFSLQTKAGEEQLLRLEEQVAKDAAITEGEILAKSALEYIQEKYPEIVEKIYLGVTEGTEDNIFLSSFVDTQSLEEQKKAIDAVVEAYEYVFDLKGDEFEYFKSLSELYSQIDEYDISYDLIKNLQGIKAEELGRNELNKNQEVVDRYKQLLEKLSQLKAQYSDTSLSVAERYGASLELDNTVSQLRAIAAEYPVVSNEIEVALDNMGVSFSGVTESVETAKEVWLKSLDEAQKGVVSDVNKIVSAMEKITAGESIDSKSAWDIINLDDNKMLSQITLDENGEYIFDLKQLISLKDQIIDKEIESREASIATAQTNVSILEKEIELNERRVRALKATRDAMVSSGINSASDERMLAELNAELAKLEPRIEEDKSSMDAFNLTIRNETLYVDELCRSYGDLSNSAGMLNAQIKALKAEIDALNSEMDARLKAQEHVIDGIIDTFKDELDVLEQRKEALNEQLETLEKQRDTIQETVDNYKTVASYVQDVIQEEIKAIEKERQAIEDAYDERIEKLRAENEEREDALEYEQKLANLNDAKNNKVLSYSSARGWTYEVDKEKLKQAENDLASFENEQQIKSLEKERDEALEGFDERIEAREKYADEWQETVDGVVEAEQEELAQQILGSEWREKIAKMDTDTLKKFKTEFNNYNTQLKGSINTEIQNLKDSIDAIGKDIDAKNKQVTAWNNYKTELQKAVTDIKGSLEDYNKYLGTVNLSESSTASDREANLQTFMSSYSELATTLNSKQKEYDAATKALNKLADAGERVMKLNLGAALGLGSGGSAQNTGGKAGASNLVSAGAFGSTSISDLIEKLMTSMSEVFKNIFHVLGFSKGGAADYTGLAMIHGSKTHSETVFTSAQSKKLLNLVDALPNFANFKLNAPKVATKSTTTNIGGSSINIGQMTVVADNPQQFEQQMNRYIQTKLTQSKVY